VGYNNGISPIQQEAAIASFHLSRVRVRDPHFGSPSMWQTQTKMKKRSETRKHCTLAVVRQSQKIFTLPQTPFPGARDGQDLISWRWSLPLPTNPVWWGSRHAISSYRGNRPTNTPTNQQTGPITIYCAAKLSAQCINTLSIPGNLGKPVPYAHTHTHTYTHSWLTPPWLPSVMLALSQDGLLIGVSGYIVQ